MKTEKTLGAFFLIGLIFKFMHWPGAGVLLIISLFSLTLVYLLFAFYFFCDKLLKRQNLAASIISGIILAIAPINILDKLMYWSVSSVQLRLLVGVIAVAILLIIIFFLKLHSSDELKIYYKNLFQRTLLIFITIVIFYIIPTETMLSIQYRNDPELARLKYLHYSHPENETYKLQHDEYLILKSDTSYLSDASASATVAKEKSNRTRLKLDLRVEDEDNHNPLGGLSIIITSNSNQKTFVPDSVGHFSFYMPIIAANYTVEVQKKGYVTKIFDVNTTDLDLVGEEDVLLKGDISLFKERKGINYFVFKKPVAKARVVMSDSTFGWDTDYIIHMKEEIKMSLKQ